MKIKKIFTSVIVGASLLAFVGAASAATTYTTGTGSPSMPTGDLNVYGASKFEKASTTVSGWVRLRTSSKMSMVKSPTMRRRSRVSISVPKSKTCPAIEIVPRKHAFTPSHKHFTPLAWEEWQMKKKGNSKELPRPYRDVCPAAAYLS